MQKRSFTITIVTKWSPQHVIFIRPPGETKQSPQKRHPKSLPLKPLSSQREATTLVFRSWSSRKIRESSAGLLARFIELFAHGHYLSVCVAIRRQQAVANLWGRSESADGAAKQKYGWWCTKIGRCWVLRSVVWSSRDHISGSLVKNSKMNFQQNCTSYRQTVKMLLKSLKRNKTKLMLNQQISKYLNITAYIPIPTSETERNRRGDHFRVRRLWFPELKKQQNKSFSQTHSPREWVFVFVPKPAIDRGRARVQRL